MMTDDQMLKILESGEFESLFSSDNQYTNNIIRNRIQDIPKEFFEPRICIDPEKNAKISLIQFSLQTAKMNAQQRRGLMERYSIDPYDVNKLQSLLNNIKVAQEVGSIESQKAHKKETNSKTEYGFQLSSDEKLSQAYMLLVAYQCFDSLNPLKDVEARLEADGTSDKYNAKSIVGIIEYTNSIMEGKTSEDKKDFYMNSISSILDDAKGIGKKNIEISI